MDGKLKKMAGKWILEVKWIVNGNKWSIGKRVVKIKWMDNCQMYGKLWKEW